MATSEEKTELVETLKGPRFYRIMLWGYGGEAAYMPLNKAQYEFWHSHNEEHGDSDLVTYMTCAEDDDMDFENLEKVPAEAHFMLDEDGDGRPWYEHHEELEHQNGVDYSNARLTIEEVEDDEYNSTVKSTIVDGIDLSEYINKIDEENNYELELTEMGVSEYEDWDAEYICQFYSAEKGTFFEGLIETVGSFDPKKLKIYTLEYANGDDTVSNIEYDGVDVDNVGGDTNGKGYSAHVWENK
jgi:hypothetical protein